MSLFLTLAVLLTWVILACAFCAIGVWGLRRLTGLEPGWRNACLAVWTGFALLMAGLLLWHFFLPVNHLALELFLVSAAAAALWEWRWFAATWREGASLKLVLAIGAFALWTANHALAPGGVDDYNYEFQAIRWFHDYPIVPGLANLHGRIGFNNSHHLFAAMLSSGPWSGSVNHIFNGLFVVLSFALLAGALRDLALGRHSPAALLGALLIAPCAGLVLFGIFGPMISTLKADVFLCAASAVLAVLFIEFADQTTPPERQLPMGVTALLLAAVLFSVKITAVVFSGVLAAAIVIRLVATLGWKHRATLAPALIAAVITGSVLLRGVILSGYPLYPSTVLPADVDWRVPVAQANAELAFITSWGQLRPTYDPVAASGWTWIPVWLRSTIRTDRFGMVLPLMLASLCLPMLLVRARAKPRPSVSNWAWAILAAACVLSLLVWFVQAPAVRFALMYFWILFAVVFTVAVRRLDRLPGLALMAGVAITAPATAYLLLFAWGLPAGLQLAAAAMILFGVLWVTASTWAVARGRTAWLAALCLALALFQIGNRAAAYVARWQFAQIGSMLWLPVSKLPERTDEILYFPRQTPQGLVVYVARGVRYETPLPNTRFFNPYLQLRVPGNLAKGFQNRDRRDAPHYGYTPRLISIRNRGQIIFDQ
jgi:hypothetical protein